MAKLSSLLVLFVLTEGLYAQPSPTTQPKQLVLTHVTVIDGTGAPPRPDMTVVISGGRITRLGKTGKIRLPNSAQVIDAGGKFVMPGLWDMDVHLDAEGTFFPWFIAHGITGVRERITPSATRPQLAPRRKAISSGTLLGPRIIAGYPVDGKQPFITGARYVHNESEARQAVIEIKQAGADFITVDRHLPRAAYFAIVDEAKKQSLPFSGQLPLAITATEASDAGQKSIEHTDWLLLSCSSREAELRKNTNGRFSDDDLFAAELKSLESYDEQKARQLFARLVKNGTWHVPTLIGYRGFILWAEKKDDDTKYTAEQIANLNRAYLKYLELVGMMSRSGVGLLAGTGTPFLTYPGISLHDELKLMVEAGLTPMQAIQAATANPARYLGLERSLGTIEKGKMADLVVLDANPLEDIGNTQKLNAVVANGRWLDRKALDDMRARAEATLKNR